MQSTRPSAGALAAPPPVRSSLSRLLFVFRSFVVSSQSQETPLPKLADVPYFLPTFALPRRAGEVSLTASVTGPKGTISVPVNPASRLAMFRAASGIARVPSSAQAAAPALVAPQVFAAPPAAVAAVASPAPLARPAAEPVAAEALPVAPALSGSGVSGYVPKHAVRVPSLRLSQAVVSAALEVPPPAWTGASSPRFQPVVLSEKQQQQPELHLPPASHTQASPLAATHTEPGLAPSPLSDGAIPSAHAGPETQPPPASAAQAATAAPTALRIASAGHMGSESSPLVPVYITIAPGPSQPAMTPPTFVQVEPLPAPAAVSAGSVYRAAAAAIAPAPHAFPVPPALPAPPAATLAQPSASEAALQRSERRPGPSVPPLRFDVPGTAAMPSLLSVPNMRSASRSPNRSPSGRSPLPRSTTAPAIGTVYRNGSGEGE
jgi:hypothetical protein